MGFNSFTLGYRVGCLLADLIFVGSGSGVGLFFFGIVRDIANTHKLEDKSVDGISDNLFKCLDYLE